MKIALIVILLFATSFMVKAQHQKVPDTAGYRIIQENKKAFPKFYKIFHQLLENEPLLKKVAFINKKGKGPGFAHPDGTVTLDLDFFINKKPGFDDNRLVVIMYHEVGHLHYYNNIPKGKRNLADSEKAAFEYSLQKTKEMALNNDCLPLSKGLYFMLQRSKSNEISDPHVRALKRMVSEPLYTEYVAFQKERCN